MQSVTDIGNFYRQQMSKTLHKKDRWEQMLAKTKDQRVFLLKMRHAKKERRDESTDSNV
jgi:hypothetical protein